MDVRSCCRRPQATPTPTPATPETALAPLHPPQVRSVRFMERRGLGDAGLSAMCSGCPLLVTLDLSGCQVRQAGPWPVPWPAAGR